MSAELQQQFLEVCDQLSGQMREKNDSSKGNGILLTSTKIVFSKENGNCALMLNPDGIWSFIKYDLSSYGVNGLEINEVLQLYAQIIGDEGPEKIQTDFGEERKATLFVGIIFIMEQLVEEE